MGETVYIMDELVLKQTASIIGPQSAAANALRERDRRKALGEDAVVLIDPVKHFLIVGPRPASRGAPR